MAKYMDRFLSDRKVRKDPNNKFSVKHDKWDKRTANQISSEVKAYTLAEKELSKAVDTGYEAMNDTLFALFKASPHLKESSEMRPSYIINHRVMDEMMKMKEYEGCRDLSIGDPIGAGLAAASMEPHLEVLFDKLKEAQKMASNMEQMLQDMEDYADKIDELLDEARNAADNDVAQDYQSQANALQAQLEALKDAMDNEQQNLNGELDANQSEIQAAIKSALNEMQDAADAVGQMTAWGTNAGGFRKLSPEARLELSKKLQTEKFKKMAELIGKMNSIAITEQTNRTEYASEEIYDLEQGSDLARVIPTEMLSLNDDTLVLDWMHRYVENMLVQYSLRGEDTVVKGGIILLEDGSSSMSGTREIWSKAIGLALLKIAVMQKRPFYAVNFAGPRQYIEFDFNTSKESLSMKKTYSGHEQTTDGIESIIDFAESAMHGGTDFVTPLSLAIDRLQHEYDTKGAVEADIVFLTDGECGVPDSFLRDFKADQARLGFNIFGIAIQTNPKSEPLNTICDSKVIGLRELTDANDLRPLFGSI